MLQKKTKVRILILNIILRHTTSSVANSADMLLSLVVCVDFWRIHAPETKLCPNDCRARTKITLVTSLASIHIVALLVSKRELYFSALLQCPGRFPPLSREKQNATKKTSPSYPNMM